MSNMKKWWIGKEEEFIYQFNSGKSGKELAEYFKVSESSITRAILDLNLKDRLVSKGDFKGYKIDWSDKKEELEKYINEDRLSLYEVAKKFDTSEGSIRRAVKKLGIKRVKYRTGRRFFSDSDDAEFSRVVAESRSIAEVLRKLGYQPLGGNYKTCNNRIKRLGLDTSHFTGKLWSKGKTVDKDSIPSHNSASLEDILNNKVKSNSSNLRERLISVGLKERVCECCKNTEWNGKPIPLQLHHIDGNHNNNTLSNLQILCPNCHAQTESYCGRGISRLKYEVPSKEELLEKLKEVGKVKTLAEFYNVSESTVRKWVSKNNMRDEWEKILKGK